jgi:UDPglucose 6-dehydrogenase
VSSSSSVSSSSAGSSGASRVAVIGAGYVGISTAACLARLGHTVRVGDIDEKKIATLATGTPTIHEDGLGELLEAEISSGRLSFFVGAAAAVRAAEFVFLCVQTPQLEDGSADTSAIDAVVTEIRELLEPGAIVVNKSTVPVGSTNVVERLLQRTDVSVVSNPEFLREGTAVHDALHPERIVVGSTDQRAAARVGALFASTGAPLIVTDAATAETIKYASNAFLATKLSFVNSIASLCEAVGADVRDVLLGMGYDPRIGFDYLRPGPGWGGSCLPKDTRALLFIAEDSGYDFELLRSVIEANGRQQEAVIAKITEALGGSVAGSRIAIWGLAFKAGTDDLRDSPSIAIARRLVDGGGVLRAYDPTVSGALADLPEVEIAADPYAACDGAQVLVVLTEWDELRWMDFDKVHGLLVTPTIVDARNLLDPSALRRIGFTYTGIGRP